MKQSIFLAIVLFFQTLPPTAAQNATEILAKATAVYNQSNGMTASFTLHTRSEVQQVSESFEGIIQMKADKFTLSTPDVKTWYDGTTQWTYVEHTEEVNVSTPEGDELQFTNPAILLGSYQKDFTAALKGETTAANGKAAYIIELTPKKKTNIVRVELQIEKYAHLPVRIYVESKNKLSNTIQISRIKTNAHLPDQLFAFPKADYPHAEIVDLR
ncbi:MAG: outer-membrane lipoprotein carrier protein LolA [Tannerellaceae bacterium]|jgi:outer membrane lipoprotein-sorting protein|nr:outer-membrane lipoprotein carrier protein LolA [Tannerellaceae bacterium]